MQFTVRGVFTVALYNFFKLEYVNNKKVLSQEDLKLMGMNMAMNSDIYAMINLTQDSLFNDVQVNPNYSTIHVPTNVYDQGKCVCLENVNFLLF